MNAPATTPWAILEIDVENHPGAMAHIVGLFTRRGCNIEGIVCVSVGDATLSRVWLSLEPGVKVPQMMKHALKLEDVRAVRRRDEAGEAFARLNALFAGS